MRIDVHAHVFAFPKFKIPNSTTFMSAEDQIAVMDAKGVDMAAILPLANAESPTEHQSMGEVLYICQEYPGRFIPFCNIDPRLPMRPSKVTADGFMPFLEQYKELGCKGVGEVTARIRFDDPCALALFEACGRLELPLTFHSTMDHADNYGLLDELGLPRFEKALQSVPNQRFVGHGPCFWSEISGDVTVEEAGGYPSKPVAPGGKIPEFMRKYPNLYADVSAGSGLNALLRDPAHTYEFLDEFQDRIMLGLDYCSVNNDFQHVEWLTKARDDKHISDDIYEKIMWQNANSIYSLGL